MKQSWLIAFVGLALATSVAQQKNPPKAQVEKSSPTENISNKPSERFFFGKEKPHRRDGAEVNGPRYFELFSWRAC